MKKQSLLAIGFLMIVLLVLIYLKSRSVNSNFNTAQDSLNTAQTLTEDQPSAENVSNQDSESEPIQSTQGAVIAAQDQVEVSNANEVITSSITQVPTEAKEQIYVLFYGETCPHCHDVLDWLESSQVEEELTIIKKEVYSDTKNNEQMKLAVKSCNLTSSGVPFLFTADKQCVVGSTPIIDYLSSEVGL